MQILFGRIYLKYERFGNNIDTRESSLVYLSKIGKTLKPFYDFETKVYGFQNEGKRIKIGFLIVGIILIVWGILVGSVGFFVAYTEQATTQNVLSRYVAAILPILFFCGIGLFFLIQFIKGIKNYDNLQKKNKELQFLRQQDSLKLKPYIQNYKKYEAEFPIEFYNYKDVSILYNLIKTQQADNLKEAFQVLRNRRFQQEQQQKLNSIQQQQNIIQRKQNLALVSQLLMSNKQNTMQKDINKLKKR
ncbi:hypothetical protein I6H59_03805 [Lactococcus garvieae]|nr:hypothetical protein I6H59_03805 [Lactococcus garvieae]